MNDYDALGQVKSGKRYWSDWTPVAGQQFEYGFDELASQSPAIWFPQCGRSAHAECSGNRTGTKTGGDSAGANLRLASYTNNSLNQITSRDVPAYLNVIGAATATATNVNVNDVLAYRKGEYYRVELNPDNAANPVWQSVTNRAVQSGTTNSVTGNAFLPKNPEVFGYDADGNLTNDGRWAYGWDGENRLVRMFAPTTAPSGSVKALTFGYDWQGRRISKTVSNYSGGAWSRVLEEKYLYDGWNLLSSLNATNSAVVQAFLWGSDLSGSMQGAGGVGGLLAVNAKGVSVTFAAYDGNGNVTALANAADGNTLATYEYGPFGEVIRSSGTAAKTNPLRFSTKFQDDESDYLYYGYRFYNQNTGRWLSRDPINEFGSIVGRRFAGPLSPTYEVNVYRFVLNAPSIVCDILGLGEWTLRVEPGDKFWFPGPMIDASYTLDSTQCCSCESFALKRYARPHYIGANITGPWLSDGDMTSEGFTTGSCSPQTVAAHALDEPGFRFPLMSWLVPLVVDFRWEVVCIRGPDKGKVLGTIEQTIVMLHNGGEWVGYPGDDTIHEKD